MRGLKEKASEDKSEFKQVLRSVVYDNTIYMPPE